MTRLLLPLIALASACHVTSFTPNEDYCGFNGGDSHCRDVSPETPYCVASTRECYDARGLSISDLACVAEQPEDACRQTCGIGNGDDCLDPTDPTLSSSSTTQDETDSSTTEDTTVDTDTDESSSTSTGCMDDDECTDPAAPFCADGTCVPCSSTAAPELACMELDPTTPLCIDDVCVQCTAENADACEGTTPVCGPANACVGCEFHEQCEALDSPACDFTDGSCFDPNTAVTVNLATAGALQNEVNAVAAGAHVALIVTGSTAATHSATVNGNKVIAIVSANGDAQNIQGAGANSILTVNGPGSTAILHRVVLQGSSARGIDVNTSGTLYADAVQVVGNDGGGITLGTATTGRLRNCMVAADDADAVSVAGELDALYSTLATSTFGSDAALACSGGASVTVRNSIIVMQGGTDGDEVNCAGAVYSNSAAESSLPGSGNVGVGTLDTTWFGDFNGGDLSLAMDGPNVFDAIAIWEDGDPSFDFEGDDRPTTDGTMDYAGADVP